MEIGPAERLDVVVDFAGKLGQEVYLVDAYKMTPLLKFRVNQHVTDNSSSHRRCARYPNRRTDCDAELQF